MIRPKSKRFGIMIATMFYEQNLKYFIEANEIESKKNQLEDKIFQIS